MSRLRKLALIASILLLCAPCIALAVDSYTIVNGATSDITEHTVCKQVTNNHASGLSIFVPTMTSPEWSSFYGSPPPGVTVVACLAACAGSSYGGYCWYPFAQNSGISCQTYCSNNGHGACNGSGMTLVETAGGALADCTNVMNLIVPGSPYSATQDNSWRAGCTQFGANSSKYVTQPLGCSLPHSSGGFGMYNSACACNN